LAEKVITVCDWHDDDTPSEHRTRWTDPQGNRRMNDLCAEHQADWNGLWEQINRGAQPDTEDTPVRPSRKRGPSGPSDRRQPTEQAIIKAWARKEGHEIKGSGRAPFHIEQMWKGAGRPNVLDG
jgi:hypothetical protein